MSPETIVVIAIPVGTLLFLAIASFVSRMSAAEKLWKITHPKE